MSRIAQTAALARLKIIWNNKHIFLSSKIRDLCALWLSQYCCAPAKPGHLQRTSWRNWRLPRWFKKLLGISYRDHVTNDAVRDRIEQAIGPYNDIVIVVKKCELKWFGHVSRSARLAKTIAQRTVQEGRRRGRQTDKRSVEKIISLSRQSWSFATPYENLKTKSNGGKANKRHKQFILNFALCFIIVACTSAPHITLYDFLCSVT